MAEVLCPVKAMISPKAEKGNTTRSGKSDDDHHVIESMLSPLHGHNPLGVGGCSTLAGGSGIDRQQLLNLRNILKVNKRPLQPLREVVPGSRDYSGNM